MNRIEELKAHLALVYNWMIISCVIGLLAFYLIWKIMRNRQSLIDVVCESCKRSMYLSLVHHEFYDPFDEDMCIFVMRVLQTFANHRLRVKCFKRHTLSSPGKVCVISSVNLLRDKTNVTRTLYKILSRGEHLSSPFLVVCSKQLQTDGADLIQLIFEDEITSLRETLANEHSAMGNNRPNTFKYLGTRGKDFEFSQLKQKVHFYEVSDNEDAYSDFSQWIDEMLC